MSTGIPVTTSSWDGIRAQYPATCRNCTTEIEGHWDLDYGVNTRTVAGRFHLGTLVTLINNVDDKKVYFTAILIAKGWKKTGLMRGTVDKKLFDAVKRLDKRFSSDNASALNELARIVNTILQAMGIHKKVPFVGDLNGFPAVALHEEGALKHKNPQPYYLTEFPLRDADRWYFDNPEEPRNGCIGGHKQPFYEMIFDGIEIPTESPFEDSNLKNVIRILAGALPVHYPLRETTIAEVAPQDDLMQLALRTTPIVQPVLEMLFDYISPEDYHKQNVHNLVPMKIRNEALVTYVRERCPQIFSLMPDLIERCEHQEYVELTDGSEVDVLSKYLDGASKVVVQTGEGMKMNVFFLTKGGISLRLLNDFETHGTVRALVPRATMRAHNVVYTFTLVEKDVLSLRVKHIPCGLGVKNVKAPSVVMDGEYFRSPEERSELNTIIDMIRDEPRPILPPVPGRVLPAAPTTASPAPIQVGSRVEAVKSEEVSLSLPQQERQEMSFFASLFSSLWSCLSTCWQTLLSCFGIKNLSK